MLGGIPCSTKVSGLENCVCFISLFQADLAEKSHCRAFLMALFMLASAEQVQF